MKINFIHIVISHYKTLINAETEKPSMLDILVFFIFPAAVSFWVFWTDQTFKSDVFGQSIAVFSIFSALLFSVQIALFGIFERDRPTVSNMQKNLQDSNIVIRNDLIKEANTNISYLIVLSCLSVTLFLLFYIVDKFNKFEPAAASFIYIHFMMTLLMIIKRVHALFQREYEVR